MNIRIFLSATTLVCAVMASSAGLPQAGPQESRYLNTQVLNLRDLLAQMVQTCRQQPHEHGATWKKWESDKQPWNALLAVAIGADTQRADLLMAMHDTLPVAALVAADRKKHYQYLRLHKNLCQGWDMAARALSDNGVINWVSLTRDGQKIILGGDSGQTYPRLLIMPLQDTSCLILTLNPYGDAFEHILLYDVRHRALTACANFALHPSAVQYLFLKGAGDTWLEFSYVNGHQKPVAIAEHQQFPGQLSAALIDCNKDGTMDVLADLAADGKTVQIRHTDVPALLAKDAKRVEIAKKELTVHAAKAHQFWLDAQGVWRQLSPLGVVLPAIQKM
ncbi:MAG: hypothetical protein SFV52_08145 [Saprospiraceae bacterium]|nr:hypothetical protein [Saprospiraceae bacterium]